MSIFSGTVFACSFIGVINNRYNQEHQMRNQSGVAAKHWVTAVLIAGMAWAGSASALLIDRGPDLVYDDVLNITWTRNANRPGSSNLTWAQANAWAANLSFAGYEDWRLPTINAISSTATATDCGAVSAAACVASRNELGYMYYVNLAVVPGNNKTGTRTAVGGEVLSGIQRDYWSGTEFPPGNVAWHFNFDFGDQLVGIEDFQFSAWAVRSGDVRAAVPEPQTVALLLAGLGLLGWRTKRR
jgi:hypothetical protein